MIVALIILGALVGVGLPLYLLHRWQERTEAKAGKTDTSGDVSAKAVSENSSSGESPMELPTESEGSVGEDSGVCCGLHLTCEKDSLLADVSSTVEYFDDEELDRFAGREATDYSPAEVEEFRDVLITLLPQDIAPWARSVQLRGITFPAEIREELLMIVAEARLSAL